MLPYHRISLSFFSRCMPLIFERLKKYALHCVYVIHTLYVMCYILCYFSGEQRYALSKLNCHPPPSTPSPPKHTECNLFYLFLTRTKCFSIKPKLITEYCPRLCRKGECLCGCLPAISLKQQSQRLDKHDGFLMQVEKALFHCINNSTFV